MRPPVTAPALGAVVTAGGGGGGAAELARPIESRTGLPLRAIGSHRGAGAEQGKTEQDGRPGHATGLTDRFAVEKSPFAFDFRDRAA